MSHLLIVGGAVLVPFIALVIHRTAWQCGRLAGMAEAERRFQHERNDEYTRGVVDGAMEALRQGGPLTLVEGGTQPT